MLLRTLLCATSTGVSFVLACWAPSGHLCLIPEARWGVVLTWFSLPSPGCPLRPATSYVDL